MADLTNAQKIANMLEDFNPSVDKKLSVYSEIYAPQFEMYKDSSRAKIKGLNEQDYLALGDTLARQSIIQLSEGNAMGDLGAIPNISLDVVTAVFGNSVIPYFASEQPIAEQQGMVYFEDVYATTTRGNVVTGDSLSKAAGVPDKYAQGFAGEMVYGEVLAKTTAAASFSVTFDNKPVRQNYVTIKIGTLVATDDGKGNLIGNGIYGTIDYTNGTAVVKTGATQSADVDIVADYSTNFELGELPTINVKLENKLVKADVFALATDTSIINNYIMQKRFGMDMKLRAVNLLQENILSEVTNSIISKIVAAATAASVDLTQFNLTLPTGVSQQAHYSSVNYTFEVIANKMAKASGRGTLSCIIASPNVCAFLASLTSRFKVIGNIGAFATVYGVLDGQTVVVRAPQLAKSSATENQAFILYKGETAFDAAAVYAPFMPLVSTNDIPVSSNLLQRRSALATMAATEVLVPKYIQKFGITNSPYYS
jgi:hypothetical protein